MSVFVTYFENITLSENGTLFRLKPAAQNPADPQNKSGPIVPSARADQLFKFNRNENEQRQQRLVGHVLTQRTDGRQKKRAINLEGGERMGPLCWLSRCIG